MSTKEYQAAWHQRNKERRLKDIKANKKAYIRRNLDFMYEYLESKCCVDCGITDIRVLEFDHRPGCDKKGNVGDIARKPASLAALKAEIAKCDIRCSNHHRIVTCERAGWEKNTRFLSLVGKASV